MLDLRQEDYVMINVWTSEKNKHLPGANVGHISVETNLKYMSFWPAPRVEEDREIFRNASKLHQKFMSSIGNYFKSRAPKFILSYEMDTILEGLSEGHAEEIKHYDHKKENQKVIIRDAESGDIAIINEQPSALRGSETMEAVTPCHANARIVLYSLDKGKIHRQFEQLHPEGWNLVGSNILMRAVSNNNKENCASFCYQLLRAGGLQNLLGSVDRSSFSSDGSSLVNPDMFLPYLIKAKDKELEKYSYIKEWIHDGQTPLDDLRNAYGLGEKKSVANIMAAYTK